MLPVWVGGLGWAGVGSEVSIGLSTDGYLGCGHQERTAPGRHGNMDLLLARMWVRRWFVQALGAPLTGVQEQEAMLAAHTCSIQSTCSPLEI